ncbi:MAG: adenylosuccinate lyase [Dehalococcoidia bacterium]|jgi:adenylosuccinate lyase|nr:adenylosuccinate lyase [Dehalococcoidia bacterium]
MIPRYSIPEISEIWSDEFKFHRWLDVEIAVVEAWAAAGQVPAEDAELIAKNAKVHVPDVMKYIDETHHDVTAFLRSVADSLGEESRWVHLGLTSSDVWDTATSLQMASAADVLLGLLERLKAAVSAKAIEHKDTICVGRTHGVHAEPTTFGLKLAVWVDEISRQEQRLQDARAQVAIGQMSGPVGTHATVPPSIEEDACTRLGLAVAPVTTQIVQRDRHAYYLSVLAGVGASLEKFATEIRGLQRTEVLEAEEPFETGQTGSSSMPHKRNPELCERVCGLARTLRGYAMTGLENVALWHERDISHSGAERITLPDSTGLLAYMLHIFSGVMEGLVVYPDHMQRNLHRTQGLVFSQKVMLALIESGLSREGAYAIVQRHSTKAWLEETPFRGLLEGDSELTDRLSSDDLDTIFDYSAYLEHVDASFERIGLLS